MSKIIYLLYYFIIVVKTLASFLEKLVLRNISYVIVYQGSELWTDLTIKLKDQSHIGRLN